MAAAWCRTALIVVAVSVLAGALSSCSASAAGHGATAVTTTSPASSALSSAATSAAPSRSSGSSRSSTSSASPRTSPAATRTSARAASPAPSGTPAATLSWMVTRAALSALASEPSVQAGLQRSRVYQLLQPGQQPLAGFDTVPVASFSSAADLVTAVNDQQLPAGTRAVLYDPEAWSFTPAAEQHDPARAVQQAAAAAHARGLQLIVTPALSLVTAQQQSSAPRWQQFLSLRLAAALAASADIIELQAQSLERDTATYRQFVREAARQAREANPQVTVMAGLSTNPPGPVVRSDQLTAAIQATREFVSGYWLNIPGRGAKCPTCNPAQPQVGIEALREILPG